MKSSLPALIRSHRWVLGAIGCTAGTLLTGCGEADEERASNAHPIPGTATPPDFAQRFAEFEPAEEPNGDLAQVAWPEFVTAAGPEIQQLYAFQVEHGHIMRYMPCFCGCHFEDGHRCAQICANSEDFMLRDSGLHAGTCGVCANACERCAESCERLAEGDELMRHCAEVCRPCAESCRRMAA